MRILVADNDSEHRAQLISICQQLGHTMQEALNLRDVLTICKKKAPDLCFIDASLSGVSGVEVIKQIRQLGGVSVWNPIVLMSSQTSVESMREGIDAGADDFCLKPINKINLEYKIKSAQRMENLKEEVFSVAHDLVLANRALENVITQDIMTGIADISKFHKDLEIEWYKAKKENTTLSMVIFDIDDFREYNNLYGSNKGDEQIKLVAATVQKILPAEAKTFARTTGVSFALLLPQVAGEMARDVGEKIRSSVEDLKVENKGSRCGDVLTVSVGVTATVADNLKNPLDLMEAADFALYQAKHKGRNKVYYEPAMAHEH